jgi:hypothetical protein
VREVKQGADVHKICEIAREVLSGLFGLHNFYVVSDLRFFISYKVGCFEASSGES